MKLSSPIISVALISYSVVASPRELDLEKRGADNCLRAIRGTPSIGLPFCSSALSISAVTSTSYVAADTTTLVATSVITDSSTLTTTTGTETVTTTATIQMAKRKIDPTANILNMCDNNASRVSSACNSFLIGVQTSTTTLLSTTTPIFLTTTMTITSITSTVATAATTTATVNVHTPYIINGGFDQSGVPPDYGWDGESYQCPNTTCYFVLGTSDPDSAPNYIIAIIRQTSGSITAKQSLTLVVGEQYEFTFRYRIYSVSNTNAAFTVILPGIGSDVFVSGTSSWQTYTRTFTAVTSSQPMRVTFQLSAGESEGFHVDSFIVTKLN